MSRLIDIQQDGMIVHIETGDADEARDLAMATEIGIALNKAYPNHYWLVSFTGHALVVRHLLIANAVTCATGKEGFGSLLPKSKMGTIPEACKEAVKFGGALLEAFKLPRGPWNGADMPIVPADLRKAIRTGDQRGVALAGRG